VFFFNFSQFQPFILRTELPTLDISVLMSYFRTSVYMYADERVLCGTCARVQVTK